MKENGKRRELPKAWHQKDLLMIKKCMIIVQHGAYIIQACGLARKLKCFETGMAHKIKLLIGLCKLYGSLDSSP